MCVCVSVSTEMGNFRDTYTPIFFLPAIKGKNVVNWFSSLEVTKIERESKRGGVRGREREREIERPLRDH